VTVEVGPASALRLDSGGGVADAVGTLRSGICLPPIKTDSLY